MKLIVSRVRDHPRILGVESLGANVSWITVHWAPTRYEIKSHLWGLFKSYRAPSHKQFAELVTSFIPGDSIVYAQFVSHLGEVQFIVQDMDRLGLQHEAPIDEKGLEMVVGKVSREFVFNTFEHNSGWESDKWSFLVAYHPIENWGATLAALSRDGVLRKGILGEAELFLANRWEHGIDVFSEKMAYGELQGIAAGAAKSLGWELEII